MKHLVEYEIRTIYQENCKCETVEDEVCTQGQACEVCDPFFIEEEICTEESTSNIPTQVSHRELEQMEPILNFQVPAKDW